MAALYATTNSPPPEVSSDLVPEKQGSVRSSSAASPQHPNPKDKAGQKRPLDDNTEDWDDPMGYMRVRQLKRRRQFKDMGVCRKSSIFQGVTIYVNGWTEPNAATLKEMMYQHGGKYEYNIYSHSVVTHTIASNLPNSKILKIGNSIVCTPDWIVDSIAANTLLPVDQYLLYKPQTGQKKLGFIKKGEQKSKSEDTVNSSEEERKTKIEAANKEPTDNGVADSKMNRPSKGTEFVNDFFSHSRLHYLSTWSMELKQFTADMLKRTTPKFPKLPPSGSLRSQGIRAVVHIDLDCFFVSVSLRDKPHLRGKPVAVTHAKLLHDNCKQSNADTTQNEDDSKPVINHSISHDEQSEGGGRNLSHSHVPLDSTSDIASCSYKAREAGVSNGMLVGAALKKCPDLILLPYDFESYRAVSQIFYEILLQYSSVVEAVSCDEAYIELTDYCKDSEHVSTIVQDLRSEVQLKTNCTVSAGIAHNMLLARMCTRVAKPDGQFYLSADEMGRFLGSQKVRDLPGVGYSTANKLKGMGIETCGQLCSMSLDSLQSQFGTKIGKNLHDNANGIDNRELKIETERKSVSVDINFGIRFKGLSEAEVLIGNLADELQKRAEQAQVMGNQISLKMKIRKPDAPRETKKYLGHGACDNLSRSLALLQPSREAGECKHLAIRLLKQLRPVAVDIRGMGLQLSKLVSTACAGGGNEGSAAAHSNSKSSAAGGDLRKMLENSMVKDLKNSPTHKMELANPHTPSRTWFKRSPKKPSPSKSPAKSLIHYFKKSTDASSSTTASIYVTDEPNMRAPSTNETLNMAASKDESFSIELPPASQLDHEVLEALPLALREKILQGYKNKGEVRKSDDSKYTENPIESGNNEIAPSLYHGVETRSDNAATKDNSEEEIVIGDEEHYLSEWKKYIREWIAACINGPAETDVIKVTDYLCKLVQVNLEMAERCLKFVRRWIELQQQSPWFPCFNTMLEHVQGKVQQNYGGTLKIKPLDKGVWSAGISI